MLNRVVLDAKTARWLPWVVAIAFFMQSLDGTILNTALPAMETPLRMQGVIIAYMLTVALLIRLTIADRFGTKKIFFGAIMLLQGIGSLLCALSSSLTMLAWRGIQVWACAIASALAHRYAAHRPRAELVRSWS